jgi:hypothetical protein
MREDEEKLDPETRKLVEEHMKSCSICSPDTIPRCDRYWGILLLSATRLKETTMTADEIRLETSRMVNRLKGSSDEESALKVAKLCIQSEIAAQLAELNENIKDLKAAISGRK